MEEEVELFIERVPGGELSDPLFALGVGEEMVVRRRAKGLFLRDAPLLDQPHLFVATVTGIAPFVSMLRTLASRVRSREWRPTPIITLQGPARPDEFGYAEELVALGASSIGSSTCRRSAVRGRIPLGPGRSEGLKM
jgi:ferredoxin--NADP+ reductase